MYLEDEDKNTLYENLLKQGVSHQQIQRVYRDLREKGYGEDEARRRSRATLERLKSRATLRERRAEAQAPCSACIHGPRDGASASEGRVAHEGPADFASPGGEKPKASVESGKRAIDWLPIVPPWLRRRINRYAYRNGFAITRLLERVENLLSIFDAEREDLVSTAFMRLLAEKKSTGERTRSTCPLSTTWMRCATAHARS
jgi:hypothetical protein